MPETDITNHHAYVSLPFADGDYAFRLGWEQVTELEEGLPYGAYWLLDRIKAGEWQMRPIREVMRLALIGGGMKPGDALAKVRLYVERRPIEESVLLVLTILEAAIFGSPAWQAAEAARKGAPAQSAAPDGSNAQ